MTLYLVTGLALVNHFAVLLLERVRQRLVAGRGAHLLNLAGIDR